MRIESPEILALSSRIRLRNGVHVQDEPVPDLRVVQHDGHVEAVSESRPGPECPVPQMGEEDDGHAVDTNESGDDGHDDEPKPEEDVNLLVDDVEGQDAEGIMSLHVS